MLKWNYALNLGLVSLLALPALPTLTGQERGSGLEQALSDTERALAHLAAVEGRVRSRDPLALELVRTATEPAAGEARARDARLEKLRVEVAALEMQRDALLAATMSTDVRAAADPLASVPDAPTTGLSEELRRELALGPSRPVGPDARREARAAPAASPAPADPLRQAQALYRAGRYADCLARADALGDEPAARYWGARALERLGREREALERFRSLAAREDGGWIARRAAEDAAYLGWKLARAAATEAAR